MKYRDTFFKELHKLCGVCGHCGKPKCSHKATHSVLPSTIAADDIFTAFERTDIALNVTYSRIIEEPQELERSPNTSSTGNGKMFVMGREGLNPSPAGSSPYKPHMDEYGEKSQAPFFVHPDTATPMTDAIDADADKNYGIDLYMAMLEHARQLEQDLNIIRRQIITCEHGVPNNRFCDICDE